MGNGVTVNDPVASKGMRYRVDRCDMCAWDARTFDFFGDRCSAACAGSSGGDHDRGVNPRFIQLFRDRPSEGFAV